LFVGGILLIFGLQWLRKAILRASGFKALRNEGGAEHSISLAAVGALAAAAVVLIAGLAVHGPLSRVPESTLKHGIGIMLTTFGNFWAGEGAGLQ
jgi:uncharacterized membrane protein